MKKEPLDLKKGRRKAARKAEVKKTKAKVKHHGGKKGETLNTRR